MTISVKSAIHLLGTAGFIVGVITPGYKALAAEEKKPTPVEVVNEPLEVDDVSHQPAGVLGFSTQTTDGYAGGVAGLHSICQTDFGNPDARVCTTEQVLKSPAITTLPNAEGWVQPTITSAGVVANPDLTATKKFWGWSMDISGVSFSSDDTDAPGALIASSLSCFSWLSAERRYRGVFFFSSPSPSQEGQLLAGNCSPQRAVLCCGPVVP